MELRKPDDGDRNLALVLRVFRSNPRALEFYRKLGFSIREKTGTGWELRWPAPQEDIPG